LSLSRFDNADCKQLAIGGETKAFIAFDGSISGFVEPIQQHMEDRKRPFDVVLADPDVRKLRAAANDEAIDGRLERAELLAERADQHLRRLPLVGGGFVARYGHLEIECIELRIRKLKRHPAEPPQSGVDPREQRRRDIRKRRTRRRVIPAALRPIALGRQRNLVFFADPAQLGRGNADPSGDLAERLSPDQVVKLGARHRSATLKWFQSLSSEPAARNAPNSTGFVR